MTTPYITPAQLTSFPTGVDWASVPAKSASSDAQAAAQMRLCWSATARVDSYCNQPLRATNDAEDVLIPSTRAAVDRWGLVTIYPRRSPVLSVAGITLARAAASSATTTIASDAIWIESILGTAELAAGSGSSLIHLSQSPISRRDPWQTWRATLVYANGWPHAGLTSAVTAGATSLAVDSALGWSVGQVAEIPDGAATEYVTVTGVSVNDDGVTGTLTTTACLSQHAAGIVVTTLPEDIQSATALLAADLVMVRGGQAVALSVTRGATSAPRPAKDERSDLTCRAEQMLAPYRRVV